MVTEKLTAMKTKKTITIIIFFILLILLGYPLVIAFLREGRLTPSYDKKIRMEHLKELRLAVANELDNSKDYSNCLYNIYQKKNDPYLFIHQKNVLVPIDKLEKAFSDPNSFSKYVNYTLYINGDNWLIVEKSGDIIVPDLLAIDNHGVFYEMSTVKEK